MCNDNDTRAILSVGSELIVAENFLYLETGSFKELNELIFGECPDALFKMMDFGSVVYFDLFDDVSLIHPSRDLEIDSIDRLVVLPLQALKYFRCIEEVKDESSSRLKAGMDVVERFLVLGVIIKIAEACEEVYGIIQVLYRERFSNVVDQEMDTRITA